MNRSDGTKPPLIKTNSKDRSHSKSQHSMNIFFYESYLSQLSQVGRDPQGYLRAVKITAEGQTYK